MKKALNHSAAPSSGPAPGKPWRWVFAIFAATLAAYAPALKAGFIWDDPGHITWPALQSLRGLARIWFEVGATQQYYPVVHSLFWLEHRVFGDVATGYHVANVLFHATAAGLFAVVLQRLKVPGAWLAALLFALHPVGVESVAWITEQKNTLSTVWYLLAALAYLRFDENRRPGPYALATFLFLLALGTKTVTASLPAALLLIFWWKRGRLNWRRDVGPLVPWFALSVVSGMLTSWVEHRFIGARDEDFPFSALQRVLLASRAIWFYLGKLVWPADLIFTYPRWEIDAGVWWQYLFPAGIVVVAVAMWRWRQQRGAVAAGLFFAGSLFPALGFVNVFPFVFSFVADHFQYLASLGIFALGGTGVAMAWGRWPLVTPVLFAGGLTVFGGMTWRQSATYRDEFTLYESTLAKNPSAAMAHNNLGNLLVNAGRVTEAIPHFEAATRLQPGFATYEYSFGLALATLRNPAAAIPHFERALQLEPDHADACFGLGMALMSLGRKEPAQQQFKAALRLKPDFPEAHLNLGLALGQTGNVAEAIEHFAAAARLRPKNPDPEFNWALALVVTNRLDEAFPHFEKAAELAPNRAYIQNSFGRALVLARRFDEAAARCRQALLLDPNLAEAHFNLSEALRQTGRSEEAAVHLAEARRLGWKK